MRDYSITKYKGNTHYQVYETDNYGREKGNFFKTKTECWKFIYEVWNKEQPLTDGEIKQNLLSDAIHKCVQLDRERGVEPNLD